MRRRPFYVEINGEGRRDDLADPSFERCRRPVASHEANLWVTIDLFWVLLDQITLSRDDAVRACV